MGLRRRRIGVLVGSGVVALGVAALVVTVVGVFSGAPAAPSSTHGAAVATTTASSTTTTTTPRDPRRPRGEHHGRHDERRHPRLRVAASRPRPSMTVPGSWYGYPSSCP